MDWAGWALFGLVATAALTAVTIVAQLAGLTRLDLPLLVGAETRIRVVTGDSVPSADAVPTLVGRPRTCPPARPPRH
jgi:hypothetical protein